MRNKQALAKRLRVLGALLLFALAAMLLISACGDKKDMVSPTTATPQPTAVIGTPEETLEPERPDTQVYRLTIDTTDYEELIPGREYVLDNALYVTLEDYPKQTDEIYDEDSMQERIIELEGGGIRLISLELSDEYSAQLTYPAWHIVYEMGENEDMALCADIYFQTDTAEYRVHTNCNADHAYGYRDDLQDYEERIAALFASIALTSESDAGFVAIDPAIDLAVAAINETRRDDLSPATFDYENKRIYDLLKPEDKALYDEIAAKVRVFEPFSYSAAEYGYDMLDRVLNIFGAVNIDHPELENSFFIRDVIEGDTTVALASHYFLPWDPETNEAEAEDLREAADSFDAACDRIIQRMPQGLSTYDKYRYLAAVISFATEYDHNFAGGWQSGTAYGAILGGYSICQGYSRGFLALCQRANLWCVCVEGSVEGESHMWNAVQTDGGIFHVDITWADESGLPGSNEWLEYFMRTDEEISVGRTISGETIEVYEKERLP